MNEELKPFKDGQLNEKTPSVKGDGSSSLNLKDEKNILENLEEEVLDATEYFWGDYEDYQIKTDGSDKDKRQMGDIRSINKITQYYTKYLLIDKKPASENDETKGLANIKKHQKLFEEDKFNWQIALPDMSQILAFSKTTISKFSHSFDIEMVDHRLFQKVFPLKVIDDYLSVVNREYGKPVYDNALRFHTNLIEIFLWHHLMADTRFHPRVSTKDINLLDPFFRIKVRESIHKDHQFMNKYFNAKFDLKKWVLKLLELYFPNVTWRYIGGGQEMHRWILLLLQYMLELGLYKAEDIPELVNLLLQKLENLLVLEKRSYQDFETSLKGYPKFNIQLKAYFYECKQIVAAICINIVVLLNDTSFKDSYPMFNPNLDIKDVPSEETVWKKAYFSNSSVGNILNRIMTTYLFQFTEKINPDEREDLFTYLNDFVMLTMDIENDVCYVSSKVVTQDLIDFYYYPPASSEVEKADQLSRDLENLVDQVSFLNLNKRKEYTESRILQGLKSFLVVLAQCKTGLEKSNFKNLLGMKCVPNMILALYSSIIANEFSKETEVICGLALTEVCVDSTICQVSATNERAMQHWNYIFNSRMLTAVMLQTSLYAQDYHLFYTHRSTMKKFIYYFQKCIPNNWSLEEEGRKSVGEWFSAFKKGILEEGNDSELDQLMTFFIYCRFLCDLVDKRDFNYESKFHDLTIQETLAKPFFGLLFNVILDKDFLNANAKTSAEVAQLVDAMNENPEGSQRKPEEIKVEPSYRVTSGLEKGTARQLKDFVERGSIKDITEHELRSAVFEVAMLTMKLLNKACSGLFQYWIYKYHIKDHIASLLDKTEYMFEIPEYGFKYRTIILQFYNNFRIFPNNGQMTSRDSEFKDTLINREMRVLVSHKNGTIPGEIIKELEKTDKIVELFRQRDSSDLTDIREFYLFGVIPVLYKFSKGVYTMYTQDAELEKLKDSLTRLKEQLEKIDPLLSQHFNIQINFSEGKGFGLGINALLGGMNQVAPAPASNHKRKRITDEEERLYPNLTVVRDICEMILNSIDNILSNEGSDAAINLHQYMHRNYSRESVIYASKSNPEPWVSNKMESDHFDVTKKLNDSQKKRAMTLASLLVDKTGLRSSELRHFYDVMDLYQLKKKTYLDKPVNENIFLKFLESKDDYTTNMISFLGRLVERFYSKLIEKEATSNSKESFQNQDELVRVYLQNEIVHSFVSFFSKVFADCNSLRNSLYVKLISKDEKDEISKSVLCLFYFTMKSFAVLGICKTFMDSQYDIIVNRYERLTEFMKNTCENNNQKFKIFLGEFVPKVKGLPSYNPNSKNLFFDSYVMLELMYNNFNLHLNTLPVPQLTDRPEVFEVAINYLKYISEVANGPCLQNQLQIYIYRTDMYVGTIKRNIHNINSSLYTLKNSVIDYISALTEGHNEKIVHHFASNFTFDIVFDLVCTTIKRLYVYCKLHGSASAYRKLAQDARKAFLNKIEEEERKEKEVRMLLKEQMEYFLIKDSKDTDAQGVKNDSAKAKIEDLETEDMQLITDEILEFVKIDDYKDIMEMYKKNDVFSSHIMIEIVFKLNEFLVRFAEKVAGYNISLENVYAKMIDLYGEEVPNYIRSKLGNYEPKEHVEPDEKCAIYMFLCHITKEIELANPDTGKRMTIFYPLMPKTFFLTGQTKDDFTKNADLENMMVDLIQRLPCFEIEMQYNLSLYRKSPFLFYFTSDDSFMYVKLVLWALGMILNLILVIFYRRDSIESNISDVGKIILISIASVISFISFFSLILWMASRYPEKVRISKELWAMEKQSLKTNAVSKFIQLYIYENLILKVYPVLFLFHITCCLLGIFVEPIFYTPQVLTVIFLSQTMMYVVQAITLHFNQLAQTIFLMLLVIYCYSVLSAEYFFDSFASNQPDQTYTNCRQLWECLTYVFNNGLRMGGGIGDVTNPFNPLDSEGRYMSKFFFDVAFFMLINVISLNIIFGIIIDTFADMRQKNEEKEEALATTCMVCQAKKTEMTRKGQDFENHISEDHFFWKYAYYLGYLVNKKMVDMTGFEGLVWENYKNKGTDWIPYCNREEVKELPPNEVEVEQKKITTEVTEIKTELKTKFEDFEKKLTSIQEGIEKIPKVQNPAA